MFIRDSASIDIFKTSGTNRSHWNAFIYRWEDIVSLEEQQRHFRQMLHAKGVV
jgi:hypothetical protein